MSNKTIAQLSAKTPLNTDLVPVADPVTGIAGKATFLDVTGGPLHEGAIYTVTPPIAENDYRAKEWRSNSQVVATNARQYQKPHFYGDENPYCTSFNAPFGGTGDWEDPRTSIVLNAKYLHSQATTIISDWTNLTSFSAPNLIQGALNFSFLPNMTTCSLPELVSGTLNFAVCTGLVGDFTIPKFKAGNIQLQTSSSLTSLTLPEFTTATGITITPSNTNVMPNFSAFNAPKLKTILSSATFSNLPSLTSINFPELECAMQGVTFPVTVSTVSMPKVKTILSPFMNSGTYNNLTNLNFPQLYYATRLFWNSSAHGFSLLTALNFPELVYDGFMGVSNSTTSPTVTPALTGEAKNITISSPNLTSITMPKIKYIGGSSTVSWNITAAPNLSVFTINSTPKAVRGNMIITGAALNQESVDNLLIALAYLDGVVNAPYPAYSSRTVNLSGGTSATPSATGLAAKATLVARGCTVTHN